MGKIQSGKLRKRKSMLVQGNAKLNSKTKCTTKIKNNNSELLLNGTLLDPKYT